MWSRLKNLLRQPAVGLAPPSPLLGNEGSEGDGTTPKLYERLGIAADKILLQRHLSYLEDYRENPRPAEKRYGVLAQSILYRNMVALWYVLLDLPTEAQVCAGELIRDCKEYFFGDWRTVKQRALLWSGEDAMRRNLHYVSEFRAGIHWSSILGDWQSARDLAQYPNEDLSPFDSKTQEEQTYCFLVANALRDDGIERCGKYFDRIAKGTSKKYKLLAELAKCAFEGDGTEFSASLDVYLKFFKQREFMRDILHYQCLDASLYLSLAKHRGLEVTYNSLYEDYLVVFQGAPLEHGDRT